MISSLPWLAVEERWDRRVGARGLHDFLGFRHVGPVPSPGESFNSRLAGLKVERPEQSLEPIPNDLHPNADQQKR